MSQLPTPPLCVTRQARDETRTPARAIRETHRGAAAALPQLDRVTNAQSPTNTSWADALRARCGPAGGLLKDSPRTCGSPTSRHGLLGVHPISVVRFVAVDFLRVQIADELQDLPADQLAGHQHREARRVGCDERRRHHIDSGIELFVDLLTGEVFAVAVLVGEIERPANVAFGCRLRPGAVEEGVVKAAEV